MFSIFTNSEKRGSKWFASLLHFWRHNYSSNMWYASFMLTQIILLRCVIIVLLLNKLLYNNWNKTMIICLVLLESQAKPEQNFILNIQDLIFLKNSGMRLTNPRVSLSWNGQSRPWGIYKTTWTQSVINLVSGKICNIPTQPMFWGEGVGTYLGQHVSNKTMVKFQQVKKIASKKSFMSRKLSRNTNSEKDVSQSLSSNELGRLLTAFGPVKGTQNESKEVFY